MGADGKVGRERGERGIENERKTDRETYKQTDRELLEVSFISGEWPKGSAP